MWMFTFLIQIQQWSRQSHHDVHDIDQSQFDDAFTPQFEQDSITIEFKCASQWRHANVMFDEISTAPSLQHVLTDLHVKTNWCESV